MAFRLDDIEGLRAQINETLLAWFQRESSGELLSASHNHKGARCG